MTRRSRICSTVCPPVANRVSAGEDPKGDRLRVVPARFPHEVLLPERDRPADAKIVEVSEGGEATDIDIALGPLAQAYTLSGRVVNENGEPVPGLMIGYGKVQEGGRLGGFGYGMGMPTNARGEFTANNIIPDFMPPSPSRRASPMLIVTPSRSRSPTKI